MRLTTGEPLAGPKSRDTASPAGEQPWSGPESSLALRPSLPLPKAPAPTSLGRFQLLRGLPS